MDTRLTGEEFTVRLGERSSREIRKSAGTGRENPERDGRSAPLRIKGDMRAAWGVKFAELLADAEFQEIGEEERVKERHTTAPHLNTA